MNIEELLNTIKVLENKMDDENNLNRKKIIF